MMTRVISPRWDQSAGGRNAFAYGRQLIAGLELKDHRV